MESKTSNNIFDVMDLTRDNSGGPREISLSIDLLMASDRHLSGKNEKVEECYVIRDLN
jgi:hypothetical protein